MEKFHPLSVIQDRGIIDRNGKHVGRIHDVLCDLKDGRIEYICIAIREGAGDEKYEAVVPWSAVRIPESVDSPWQVAANRRVLEDIARPLTQQK